MKVKNGEIRRFKISKILKELRNILFSKIYLPKINPNLLSSFSILLSMLFILIFGVNKFLSTIILTLILILDALDGEIARRYKISSEKGYIIDIICDRVSESLLVFPLFYPWFFIFTFNLFLTIISFNKRIHIIFPLRHVLLLYFLIFI